MLPARPAGDGSAGLAHKRGVVAAGQVGTGLVGSPLSGRTAAVAPMAPPQPGVNCVTQTTAMLSWGPPSFDGGAPITRCDGCFTRNGCLMHGLASYLHQVQSVFQPFST